MNDNNFDIFIQEIFKSVCENCNEIYIYYYMESNLLQFRNEFGESENVEKFSLSNLSKLLKIIKKDDNFAYCKKSLKFVEIYP